MVARRNIITAVMAVLFVAGVCCADVMPFSRPDSDLESQQTRRRSDQQRSSYSGTSLCTDSVDLCSLPLGPLLSEQAGLQRASEPQPLYILSDEHDSLSLCLYALLGLGLCHSAPCVKKLSFGCIPEWYHDGGPFQIGHSYALGPDCLDSASVCCFVQPDCGADDSVSHDYWGTMAALLRKSIFTPTLLTSRSPPLRSC